MNKVLVVVTLLASVGTAAADEPAPAPPAPVTAAPGAVEPVPAPAATEPAPGEPPGAPVPQATDGEAPAGTPVAAPPTVPSAWQPLPYAQPLPVKQSAVRDTEPDLSETPPLSGGRLLGEAVIGGLFGLGGTIGGAYIGYSLETADGCNGEWCGFGGLLIGGMAGLTFVTPVGVYLIGSSDGQTGSLGATIGGSVIGSLAGIGAAAVLQEEDAAVVLVLAGPIVGSMIGFNVTRKYDDKHRAARWAPVANVSHGNTSFGVAGRF